MKHSPLKVLGVAAAMALGASVTTQAMPAATRITLPANNKKIFVSGINLAWISYASDVVSLDSARLDAAMKAVHDSGGNTMRIWLSANGTQDPVFVNHYTSKPNSATIGNVQKMLRLAKKNDLLIIFSLLSHNYMQNQGQDTAATRLLLTTDSGISAFTKNYVTPLVTAIGADPNLLCWEVCNEPEGMLSGSGWTDRRISKENIQKLVNRVAGTIHRAVPNVLVSNGAVTMAYTSDVGGTNWYSDANLKAVGGDADGTLDFYMAHYYGNNGVSNSPFTKTYSYWKLDKPLVIGEYPSSSWNTKSDSYIQDSANVDTLLTYLDNAGYAGGLGWQYGQDDTKYLKGFSTFGHSIAIAYKNDSSAIKLSGLSDNKFAVTVSVGNGGSVTRSPTGRIDSGKVDTIIATPLKGYVFTGWTGDAAATSDTLIIKVTKDLNLAANFTPDATTNLIKNGDFSAGSDNWGDLNINADAATANAASASFTSGAAVITTTKADATGWHIQLAQSGIPFELGATYIFTFDASASAARTLEIGLSSGAPGWKWLGGGTVSLTSSTKTYTLEVKDDTASATAGVLQFQVGGATGTLTIDNVTLVRKSSGSGILASKHLSATAFTVSRAGTSATWSRAQALTNPATLRVLDAQGRTLAHSSVAAGVTSGMVPSVAGSGLRWIVLEGKGVQESALLPSVR